MIAYVDTSVLVRAFLPDENGHPETRRLLDDDESALITGTWTRVELASALTRAARNGRSSAAALVDAAMSTVGDAGRVAVVTLPQDEVERAAFALARDPGLRAMDAWHVAVAGIALPMLAEPGEARAFATRDREQAAAARALGFEVV